MTISQHHQSPFFDSRLNRKGTSILVVHSTGSNSLIGTLSWFKSPNNNAKTSAHYVIGKKGDLYQMVDDEDVAYHAGAGEWNGVTNINRHSIGIEVVADTKTAYTDEQIASLHWLCVDLMTKHRIKGENLVRHSDIAPGRKADPYTANLEWEPFKEGVVAEIGKPLEVGKHYALPYYERLLKEGIYTKQKDFDTGVTYGELSVILCRMLDHIH